jgi:hypothetical protein
MERRYVVSTDLQSVGYDEATMTLEIEFRGGGLYRYSRVPDSVYQALMRAASKGTYFHSFINERYLATRIR